MSDENFMKQALLEAKKAESKGEIPIGAVIVHGDQIIAKAHNLTETLHDVTAHAEMQAITMAADFMGGKYLTDCTLYVTVEPCSMCAGTILWTRLNKIVYGAKDPKGGAICSSFSLFDVKNISNQICTLVNNMNSS